ncbi:MAG: [LysW]-lysine hydrolase [Candidatus Promineifilaceae bacterium]
MSVTNEAAHSVSSLDAVDVLRELVTIRSLSREEAQAANYLAAVMQRLNYDTAFVDEAGNAVGSRQKLDENGEITCEIVLLGHMDTVPGDIPVRIEDGILHGRGSVDAKGPLATFVMAVAAANIPAGTRYVVVGAVEEEAATSKGARFVAKQYRPDYCIIGEPSGWDGVTLGYKGRILLDYHIEAEMGHTAGQQSGVAESAIAWWNQVDAYVQAFNADKSKLFDLLIPSIRRLHTDSDGLIDSAEIRIGIRTPLNFDLAEFEAMVRAFDPNATIRAHSQEIAFTSDRKTKLARAFNIALRQANVRPKFKRKTGTSDMNVVAPVWQCPIVAYGPGDSKLDHTPHEHLVLDEYQKAIAILTQVLETLR